MNRAGVLALLAPLAACATASPAASRDGILAVDEQQRALVAAGDATGLDRLAHRDLRINAPTGRVLTKEAFLGSLKAGGIGAERFERTAEDVSITGNVAVVMGRETFTPTPSSDLGRLYGAVPLQRRYTNIYLWEDGRWQWLARQAAVVPPSAGPP